MFGLFSLLGRSRELQRLDHALRGAGLVPRAIPDAVKIACLRQLKGMTGRAAPSEDDCDGAAQLIGYCMLGRRQFAQANDDTGLAAAETRVAAALAAPASGDAQLILLALHAGIVEASVVDRYDLTVD